MRRLPAPPHADARLLTTRFITVTALISALTIIISACASNETPAAGKGKEAWLEHSFPASPAGSKPSSLIQMPAATQFRQQILQGQARKRMTLEDAFATLRMQPYGTQPQQAVYWCDASRVNACSSACIKCQATLFGQNSIVFLEGPGNKLAVNDFYPKRFEDFRATVDASAIRFAEQIYQRRIVPGMSAGLVQMIINQEHYQTRYYCDTQPQPDTRSCLGRCGLCKVDITGRSSAQAVQSIFLETHAGQQTVANVLAQ